MATELNQTVGGLLEAAAKCRPEHDALVYHHRGLSLSYGELNERCDRVARGLLQVGIGKGDRVAIWATNLPEWVILQFATAKIGAVLVTINTRYRSSELEYVLRQSDATALFLESGVGDNDFTAALFHVVPELRRAAPGQLCSEQLPYLRQVFFFGGPIPPGMSGFDELERLGEETEDHCLAAAKATLDPDEVINMQYTSGTTGFPKGVMLSHRNIVNNAYQIGTCMEFGPRDRLCIPVPFFHCFGCVLGVLACVAHGATMVPVETFDALKVLEVIEGERCTAVHGVPTMFIAELDHPAFPRFDLSSLRTGIMAGSPCPIEVMRRVIRDMHCEQITIAYGQTESSPVITQTRTDDPVELRVNSVGRALPKVEVKIVDPESGANLPCGEQGELCTRGYLVMKGYYKMPEATGEVLDPDGWLHTGDLAVMDGNGYCRITGRLKDMIIRGGENVYPREVEEFLYTHPKIADVQVFGVPDRKYGEEVMAAIKLRDDAVCSPEEIRNYCRERIASFKIPRHMTFVDHFPMTASGKVQKFKLREMAIRDLRLEETVDNKEA